MSTQSTENCKFCNRLGLSFLPLRYAYVPDAPSSIPSSMQTRLVKGIQEGGYQLRVITEGYVYIYDERAGGFWKGYAATASGEFKELALDTDTAPAEQPKFTCSRAGHNIVSSIVSIENAIEAGDVWVGYSRVLLTKNARKKLKKDTGLRDELMVKFNAKSVVTGGSIPDNAGFRITSADGLSIAAPEYADEALRKKYQLGSMEKTSSPAVKRSGQAEALTQRMEEFSPNNAIALTLPDTVGIMQDINGWRNLQAGMLDQYTKKEEVKESHIIGNIVLGLEDGMKAQGQAAEWNKRFKPKVDYDKIIQDKNKYESQLKRHERKIISCSDDWCLWSSSKQFMRIWHLYDVNNTPVGASLEQHFATCVFGSGCSGQVLMK